MSSLRFPEEGPLITPEREEWPRLIEENRGLLSAFEEERREVRKAILGEASLKRPLYVSGHQPLLFHPGIWARNALLEELEKEDGCSLFLVLDHDSQKEVGAFFPRRDGHLRKVWRSLHTPPLGVAWESLPPPREAEFEEFRNTCLMDVETIQEGERSSILEEAFEVGLRSLKESLSLSDFLKGWRKSWEGSQYREINLSELSKKEVFWEFFMGIAERAEEFARISNSALENVRKRRRIRTRAQPFRDLVLHQERVELPFWVLLKGRRGRPFLSKDRKLEVDGETLGKLDALRLRLKIRPKALTLSIFSRLFLADLFIHGIGGARYEEVVDDVLREFFSISPPHFVVVTLSLGIPPATEKPDPLRVRDVEEKLRDMESHPERYVESDDPVHLRLVKEVYEIVEKMRFHSGPVRRDLGRRLREIRSTLQNVVAQKKKLLLDQRSELMIALEEWEVLSFREYPFILFRFEEVKNALQR